MHVLDESVRIKVNKRLGDTAGSSTDVNNRTPQAPSMAAAALISSDTRHSADDRSIITMPEFFITNSAQREKNGAAFGKRVLQTLTRSYEGIRNGITKRLLNSGSFFAFSYIMHDTATATAIAANTATNVNRRLFFSAF